MLSSVPFKLLEIFQNLKKFLVFYFAPQKQPSYSTDQTSGGIFSTHTLIPNNALTHFYGFLFFKIFIYLFIFGCIGSSLLRTGFL